ncbi:MAG: 3'-5' exonuclease, partial [Verrucomicrobiota bacterium]
VEDLTGVPRWKVWGGTFHSIGQRTLRSHGETVGVDKAFTILDQGDAESLLGDVIRGIDGAFLKNKEHPKARLIFDVISYARNTRRGLAEVISARMPWLEDLSETLQGFASAYTERKQRQQTYDYDDLLELWLKLLETDEAARIHYQGRFKHILVDEYQDTNKLQGSIVNLLAARQRNLMVVGDNWQCIYTWRGAEFANMDDFADVFPERTIYKIQTNYRSTPQILGFANQMMEGHPPIDGYPLELQAHREAKDKPFVLPCMDTRQQADLVIKRLEGLQHEGRSLKDVAVLYRAHYQAMDLQMELSRRGVPYTITSGVRFFEQAHIRDLVAQLRVVANPRDSAAFERLACLLPRVGPVSAKKLFTQSTSIAEDKRVSLCWAMLGDPVVKKVPADAREDWKSLAQTLIDMERAMGGPAVKPLSADDDLFETPTAVAETKTTATPQEVVKLAIDGWYGDYLRNLYDNWQSRRDDLDSLLGFAARYEDMSELLAQLVLLNSETSDRRIDPDEETIKLTTIHQAKGLEFPVVFVLGLAEGLLPLKRAIEEGDVEEERRLLYVAVTRAKDELYLCYPRVSTSGGPPQLLEPSRFLSCVSDEHYELLRVGTTR